MPASGKPDQAAPRPASPTGITNGQSSDPDPRAQSGEFLTTAASNFESKEQGNDRDSGCRCLTAASVGCIGQRLGLLRMGRRKQPNPRRQFQLAGRWCAHPAFHRDLAGGHRRRDRRRKLHHRREARPTSEDQASGRGTNHDAAQRHSWWMPGRHDRGRHVPAIALGTRQRATACRGAAEPRMHVAVSDDRRRG
jgi:hypothetical protein